MIVLELLPKGDLRHFLNDIKPEYVYTVIHNYAIVYYKHFYLYSKHSRLPELLLKFCREIASGMEYLSKKCFIHRDLAARNILLSKQLTCKVTITNTVGSLYTDTIWTSKLVLLMEVSFIEGSFNIINGIDKKSVPYCSEVSFICR